MIILFDKDYSRTDIFHYHQQILEYIKEEGYTLLPNNILTSLVESNAEQFNKLYSLQDKILTALNEFNTSINKLSEVYNINNQNNEMNKRFDTLFNLISKNNMVLERQPQQTNRNINETYLNNIKENITMETKNRKRLHYQIYRAQELMTKKVREWNKHLDYLMNIYNQEQNDDSVDNLLKFVDQKPEENETTHSKSYRQHYQLPRKRYP